MSNLGLSKTILFTATQLSLMLDVNSVVGSEQYGIFEKISRCLDFDFEQDVKSFPLCTSERCCMSEFQA